MLVTFRIIDTETPLHSIPARINARELAALRVLLQESAILPDIDDGETEAIATHFEFNANSLALATFARTFGHREDIITVVEEAQFLGRSLRIDQSDHDGDIVLRVSSHIAIARPLMMSEDLAGKLLRALGINTGKRRSIHIDQVRDLLADPAIYAAFQEAGITPLHASLSYLGYTELGDQIPIMEWA